MSLYNMNIVGEENDTPPIINKHNIVIETKWNGFRMMDDASFTKWETIFIFPDNEKAEYFAKHMEKGMNRYQEGMLKDDYIFHKIDCKYPAPEKIYADQLRMSSNL